MAGEGRAEGCAFGGRAAEGCAEGRLREQFEAAFGAGATGNVWGNEPGGALVGATRGVAGGAAAAAGRRAFVLASAPGRLEVAGNHVDHQGGRVISAAIDERTWGLAAENGLDRIRVVMEGFGTVEIDLAEPCWDEPQAGEALTSAALVRGMAAAFARAGGTVRGFDLATASEVPAGCGLSSSAAFEVMLGACLEGLFGPGPFAGNGAEGAARKAGASATGAAGSAGAAALDPIALALAATEVEQRYFGKPCGAQDQLASACGGVVTIDFAPPVPKVEVVPWRVREAGYEVVLVDSRQDHSLCQDEFAAVPADMFAVAHLLGAERLGDVPAEALLADLPRIRAAAGDVPVMRALHYYDEVARVSEQRAALKEGDFPAFLGAVRRSGASSAQFLQNVSSRGVGASAPQPAMLIQALCAHLLGERGAWRIHGGGFGGSVLVFVPAGEADDFAAAMDRLLGYDACRRVIAGSAGAQAERLR